MFEKCWQSRHEPQTPRMKATQSPTAHGLQSPTGIWPQWRQFQKVTKWWNTNFHSPSFLSRLTAATHVYSTQHINVSTHTLSTSNGWHLTTCTYLAYLHISTWICIHHTTTNCTTYQQYSCTHYALWMYTHRPSIRARLAGWHKPQVLIAYTSAFLPKCWTPAGLYNNSALLPFFRTMDSWLSWWTLVILMQGVCDILGKQYK